MNEVIAILLEIVATWQWGLFTTVVMLGAIWTALVTLRKYMDMEVRYDSLTAEYMSAMHELRRLRNAFPVVSEPATLKQLPQLPGQSNDTL